MLAISAATTPAVLIVTAPAPDTAKLSAEKLALPAAEVEAVPVVVIAIQAEPFQIFRAFVLVLKY